MLISSELESYITATSYISPYLPSQARTSGFGWCAACSSTESQSQAIEVDFGAEVIIDGIAILRAGGGYVTHYNVEYAGLEDRDYHCIRISNEIVRHYDHSTHAYICLCD